MTISNSGRDENGRYSGGTAGDQGGEWVIRSWYNRPWLCVLRHPDSAVRADIAKLAKNAANNDKIGYDQEQRTTFWNKLSAAKNYDPANIAKACEADCSAGVAAIVKAVGYRKGIEKLKAIGTDTYTGNMRSRFKAAGFTVLTDSKYLTSEDYLLAGDILLNDSHHVCTNLTDGSKAGTAATKPTTNSTTSSTATSTGGFDVATLALIQKGSTGPQVKSVQALLNGKNNAGLVVDGDAGSLTDKAIRDYQRAKGLEVDGQCGKNTWTKLLTT